MAELLLLPVPVNAHQSVLDQGPTLTTSHGHHAFFQQPAVQKHQEALLHQRHTDKAHKAQRHQEIRQHEENKQALRNNEHSEQTQNIPEHIVREKEPVTTAGSASVDAATRDVLLSSEADSTTEMTTAPSQVAISTLEPHTVVAIPYDCSRLLHSVPPNGGHHTYNIVMCDTSNLSHEQLFSCWNKYLGPYLDGE